MPYLYIHVPIFETEPFVSSFCRGTGKNYYRCGVVRSFKIQSCKPKVPSHRNLNYNLFLDFI